MRLACFMVVGWSLLTSIPASAGTPQSGIVTDSHQIASIFDTDPAAVRTALRLAPGGTPGDCAISPDGRWGYVTDFNHHLWVLNLTSVPPQLAPGINPIVISNPGEDVAATSDGRYLVICDGSAVTPVSVVDTQSRLEVDTLSLGPGCNSVDVCSNGSVLVTTYPAAVRRLVIDASGQLSDTGESLSVPGGSQNVVCSPDGLAGVAVGRSDSIRSFRIPGLIPVSDRVLSQSGRSGAMALDGTRFYVRSFDAIEAFDFDSASAELGSAPVFKVNAGGALPYFGVDQLALDATGARLYAPEPHRLAVFDSVTGATLPALPVPDFTDSGGICLGPRAADECVVSACDDANPCTDDACDGSSCLHVPNDDPCGDPEDCSVSHLCSEGACVATEAPDCDAPCPPGFTEDQSLCKKSYEIDASLLDNLSDSCDGTGTNRFNCEGSPFGFHWTDVAGNGVGEPSMVNVELVDGRHCAGGLRTYNLNGVSMGAQNIQSDCSCSAGHAPRSLYSSGSAYVRDGLNVFSVEVAGGCAGLSSGPALLGLFGRVTVWFFPQDPNCSTGTCNSATHRCEYAVQDCDDGDPCTDDTCDGEGGCVHTLAESAPCEDGDVCNGFEYCHADGGCYADDYLYCFDDGNPCTIDYCDPSWGCVYAAAPDGSPCSDGNSCTTDDACRGPTCVGAPAPLPPEVSGVEISHSGGTVVSWMGLGDVHYDIASSSFSVLRTSGPNAASCLVNDVGGLATSDNRPEPPAGDGYVYMVRGQTACATGTYGSTSGGTERLPATACP